VAHTPGPWDIGVSVDHTAAIIVPVHPSEGSGFVVAHINRIPRMSSIRGEMEANASLIAAAPELLEVLRNIERTRGCLQVIREVCRAAIAKAEGKR
jgi:hypothetical protein